MASLRLSDLWRLRRNGPWRIIGEVVEADQVPDSIPKNGAIRVGSARAAKWLAFDCPCDQGHRVLLNLDERRWPVWRVRNTSPLTIWPSVDAKTGSRRCHYFIDRGHVFWTRPSGTARSRVQGTRE